MQIIPVEIVFHVAYYCDFGTLISLLQVSKLYNESEKIYCILILRTNNIVSRSKLLLKSLEELKELLYVSYNDIDWFTSYEDILDETKYQEYLTQRNLDTFSGAFITGGDTIHVGCFNNMYSPKLKGSTKMNPQSVSNCKSDSVLRLNSYITIIARKYEDYRNYTIEDVKNLDYFYQHEIIFLDFNVASEYLSKQEYITDNGHIHNFIFNNIFCNKEDICPESLILWHEKCIIKSKTQLIKLSRLLENYPNNYIFVVGKYINDLTDIHLTFKRNGEKKLCVEEKLFKSLFDDPSEKKMECLRLLISLCMEKEIYVYSGEFNDSSFYSNSCNIYSYILQLLEEYIQTNILLKTLLSFDISISKNFLLKATEISPMKFKFLLPYCDDTGGLEDELRNNPSYYYML